MLSKTMLLAIAFAAMVALGAALPLGAVGTGMERALLGKYWVNSTDVHVSGLSAGAYMAVQLHVAFSRTIHGAAALAGGPYYCARGSVSVALTACMTTPGAVDVDALIAATDRFAAAGDIDPTDNIRGAPVYIFAGTRDGTVDPEMSRLLATYYEHYLDGASGGIRTEYGIAAGHAHLTDNYGNACGTASQSPYISDCDYDMAGVLLAHVAARPLQARTAMADANLLTFEQAEFGGRSMDALGFVYVPTACQAGTVACGVHIALHGCLQARSNVGDVYAVHAGYNEWAEANNLIVLYPQADADALLGNPNACFDWFGYTGGDYAVQGGSQMAAIKAMLDRIASGGPTLAAPTGLRVVNVTDASITVAWVGVPEADSYTVLIDGGAAATGVTATQHTVDGLPSGSTFAVAVQATTAAGAVSAPSAPLAVSTTGPPPPLAAPQNVRVTSTTATSVALAWNAVTGAASYVVTRDAGAAQLNTTSAAVTDTGLAPETTYTYTVRALAASGSSSPSSAAVQATTRSTFVCTTYEDSNYAHVASDRAYVSVGYAYALGSDDYMGLYNTFYRSTLSETAPDYFIVGECP